MTVLRKIDLYVQSLAGIFMIISIPFFLFYGVLAGLYILGCLQLFSAAFNSNTFLRTGLGKQICNYWKYVGLIMGSLFLCVPLGEFFDPDDVQVLAAVAVCLSAPVAVYYYIIYYKLINTLALQKEIGGLIKSTH